MSRKTDGPLRGRPQAGEYSRRDLLKRALVVLGVGVLVQPNGGVSGSAFADTAKDKWQPAKGGFDVYDKHPGAKTGAKSGSNPLKPNAKTGTRKPAKHPKPAETDESPK